MHVAKAPPDTPSRIRTGDCDLTVPEHRIALQPGSVHELTMPTLGLETEIVDRPTYGNSVRRFREAGIVLPTFAQLAEPASIDDATKERLAAIHPDAADPLNLFRVHWYNDPSRRAAADLPAFVEIPESLSGVPARILLVFGDLFPMILSHKVLAAFGCLAPRVVTGQFDPTRHRAVWPSTGNFCRGGVAISRIMNCRGVAVLPENMSRERFNWLERWVLHPSDIIRTPGSESNVKEIYDKCAELSAEPANVIFNQFCEFGNYLVHRTCTGPALLRLFESLAADTPGLRLAAFVAASGSAGTLAAGDHLKANTGARIVVAEALECPTLLYSGYGEHNIQGIGDKHVPFIHNVMNTDLVVGVSDRATDTLNVLFETDTGRAYLAGRRNVPTNVIESLGHVGLSAICNMLAAVKTARHLDLGPDDVVVTVATDGAAMYASETGNALTKYFGGEFDAIHAGEVWAGEIRSAGSDHVRELDHIERKRMFNLGYFTWVEQQGVALADFETRRDQAFWDDLLDLLPAWDALIEEFNARSGTTAGA